MQVLKRGGVGGDGMGGDGMMKGEGRGGGGTHCWKSMESIISLVSSGRLVRKRILFGASLPEGGPPGTERKGKRGKRGRRREGKEGGKMSG